MNRFVEIRATFTALVFAACLSGPVQAATPEACTPATPEANEALAQTWVQNVLDRALEDPAVLDTFLPEGYIHHDGFGLSTIEGLDDFKKFQSQYFAEPVFTELSATTDQVVATPEKAVAAWTLEATYQGGQGGTVEAGTPVSWTGITIMRVECGKVAESWTEADALYRLQQIGAVAEDLP